MVCGCVSGFLKGLHRSNEQSTMPGERLFQRISVNSSGTRRRHFAPDKFGFRLKERTDLLDVQTCRPRWKRFEHYEAPKHTNRETPDSREMNVIYQAEEEMNDYVFTSFLGASWESHTSRAEPRHACSVFVSFFHRDHSSRNKLNLKLVPLDGFSCRKITRCNEIFNGSMLVRSLFWSVGRFAFKGGGDGTF